MLGTSSAARRRSGRAGADGSRCSKEAERIFRLLKILHPDRDMHSAYVGLRSEDPVVHDNAVEFLDTILTPGQRTRLVVPLFDRNVRRSGAAASASSGARRVAGRSGRSDLGDDAEPRSVAAVVRGVRDRRHAARAVCRATRCLVARRRSAAACHGDRRTRKASVRADFRRGVGGPRCGPPAVTLSGQLSAVSSQRLQPKAQSLEPSAPKAESREPTADARAARVRHPAGRAHQRRSTPRRTPAGSRTVAASRRA